MKYVQCPEIYNGKKKSLFLAGGITNCPVWQRNLVELLKETKLVLINPRRGEELIYDLALEKKQIKWEFYHLKKSSGVSFWFPKETLCPITLYELGKEVLSKKPLFVGIHPDYLRKRDLEIQLKLIRPEVNLVYSLEDLAEQIKAWDKQSLNKFKEKR